MTAADSASAVQAWQALQDRIISCRLCPRLVAHREEVAQVKRRSYREWEYWGKPVPGFGDPDARLLVVGLAPGAHGSNRTGRMFTGDGSGDFLYPALYRAGFASQPNSAHRQDGQTLNDIFITAVARCAPPGNKPAPDELRNCRPFLVEEISLLDKVQGVVALGKIAYDIMAGVLGRMGASGPVPPFGHGVMVEGGERTAWLLGSYHPSRQNTQTGRLTAAMFDRIWTTANLKLSTSAKRSMNIS
jgi:uracil-DNA glycosylase